MREARFSILERIGCAVWGHVVDNHVFRQSDRSTRRCRCGSQYLDEDGHSTHVRHTLSCFLRHHTYVRLTDRDGAHEYVCVRCGHPLVYPAGADPFAARSQFTKKVRYLCGVFGHRVKQIAVRNGFTEYACHCGHSFLRADAAEEKIRHPLRCFFFAHRIRFVSRRDGYAEYVCRDCGHPFCFVIPSHGSTRFNTEQIGPQATVQHGSTRNRSNPRPRFNTVQHGTDRIQATVQHGSTRFHTEQQGFSPVLFRVARWLYGV